MTKTYLSPPPALPAQTETSAETSTELLTAEQFLKLADVPPEIEWFANIDNPQTRRAYQNDLRSFMRFVGIEIPQDFRIVTRSHVLAWRKTLEDGQLGSWEGRPSEGSLPRCHPCSSTCASPMR
jgi:hypothetical protein